MNTYGTKEEILICTIDDYQYFLGPEYAGELDWENAKKWCKSLGEDYELPNRLVMLAICLNEKTAALLTDHHYYWSSTEFEDWTSTEVDDASRAWRQYWNSGLPGAQFHASKSASARVRAVRRRRIEEVGK